MPFNTQINASHFKDVKDSVGSQESVHVNDNDGNAYRKKYRPWQ